MFVTKMLVCNFGVTLSHEKVKLSICLVNIFSRITYLVVFWKKLALVVNLVDCVLTSKLTSHWLFRENKNILYFKASFHPWNSVFCVSNTFPILCIAWEYQESNIELRVGDRFFSRYFRLGLGIIEAWFLKLFQEIVNLY